MHEDDGEEDQEHGKRELKKLHEPRKPTAKAVKEHEESGHIPYRSWCPHCVMGRGKEMDHRRRKAEDEGGIPEYHMDYCFPGDDTENKLTILAVIERYSKTEESDRSTQQRVHG